MRTRDLQPAIWRHFAYWRPVLGLEGWQLILRFDEKVCQAYCDARPKYLQAVLGFNLTRIQKEIKTDALLEELVLHEMIHAVFPTASETAVSQYTFSLLRARALGAQG
jgi:hypothetical protein